MPTLDDLDTATIDLIFVLRDSVPPDGPKGTEFWGGRIHSALEKATSTDGPAAYLIAAACAKLQIVAIPGYCVEASKSVAAVIDANPAAWCRHVQQGLPQIVALAQCQNRDRKLQKKDLDRLKDLDQ